MYIKTNIHWKVISLLLVILLLSVLSVNAVPPHPDLLKNNSGKITPFYLANHDKLEKDGLDAPSKANVLGAILNSDKSFINTKASVSGNFNILAILVQFSDNASATVSTDFDSLIFSANGNTVRDYYNTNS